METAYDIFSRAGETGALRSSHPMTCSVTARSCCQMVVHDHQDHERPAAEALAAAAVSGQLTVGKTGSTGDGGVPSRLRRIRPQVVSWEDR
jgi:hypothetical protein